MNKNQKIAIVAAVVILAAAGWVLVRNLQGNPIIPGGGQSGNKSNGTEVIKFVPALPAVEKSGDCWGKSLVAFGRADAWQCNVENQEDTYDPCFSLDSQDTVICGANPVSGDSGFAVRLVKPLPSAETSAPVSSSWGWLLLLKNGTVCAPVPGVSLTLEGQAVKYGCEGVGDGGSVVVLGDLDAAKPFWVANVATFVVEGGTPKISKTEKIEIAKVWQ